MIIRSQIKREITTDLNLYIDVLHIGSNDTLRVYIKNKTVGTIGCYSDYEKAIKVLDMIQNFYCKCESAKVVTSGIWGLINKYGTLEDAEKYRDEHRELFVFQMPQDSEV